MSNDPYLLCGIFNPLTDSLVGDTEEALELLVLHDGFLTYLGQIVGEAIEIASHIEILGEIIPEIGPSVVSG